MRFAEYNNIKTLRWVTTLYRWDTWDIGEFICIKFLFYKITGPTHTKIVYTAAKFWIIWLYQFVMVMQCKWHTLHIKYNPKSKSLWSSGLMDVNKSILFMFLKGVYFLCTVQLFNMEEMYWTHGGLTA